MKKLIPLLSLIVTSLLFGTPEAEASHMAGGDIWYEYIGTPTNPHRYCLRLRLYRRNEPGAASPPTTATIYVNSSCFSQQTITMSRYTPAGATPASDGGVIPQDYTPCVSGNVDGLSEHWFGCGDPTNPNAGIVDLPGKCADFVFSYSLCCRHSAITNLSSPSGYSLYISADLNNTIGPNTSPEFINPAAKAFCLNQPFTWSQATMEPDGDSVIYKLAQPLDGPNTLIPWAAGYSTAYPMTTNPPNTFSLNSQNGTMNFTPGNVEIDVLKIVVDEYRFDSTTFNTWLKIGSVTRDVQIPIVATCNPNQAKGVQVDTTLTGPGGTAVGSYKASLDSIKWYGIPTIGNNDSSQNSNGIYEYTIPIVPYSCYDSVVTLKFSNDLLCASFAPDGSDFRLVGPDTVARPVIGVNTKCNPTLQTNEVDLILHKALDVNGYYLLYVKPGNDGNTLQTECGYDVGEFFSMFIHVEDCPILDYEMENVSVENDKNVEINWTVDPTSFSQKLFTTWNILRANDNDQFYPIDTVNDVNARSYIDTSLDYGAVDNVRFQYAVQLVENFTYRAPTNNIRTILLTSELNNDTTGFDLEWTEYDGWDSAAYEVFWGEKDTSSNTIPNWYNYDGPNENFFGTDYILPTGDHLNADTAGIYAFKVEATEPGNPSNNYSSESNWIYIQIHYEEPPVIEIPIGEIPNVFTPNGDGVNDVFTIAYAEQGPYQNVKVAIYNRNGRIVFEQDQFFNNAAWNGQDMNSGQKVADGVYYYVVTFTDKDGKTEQKTGQLSIFARGTD